VEERYERHEEIGSGGIGTVFRGTHVALGRPVAIKEIRDLFGYVGESRKSDIVAKFALAVQQHAKLIHPAIIQVLDIDVDGEFPFFVMEYAPNGSLRGVLKGDRPELPTLLQHFVAITQALRFAHSHGVIHADLKPENVVFDADGHAKLVDFGVSRIIETDTTQQQIYIAVGSRAYKSPEQFVNPVEADARSDIYSLGIMFYEMLTGKLPGRRSPLPSSLYPEIPRKLDDVFDNMCMDSPEDRYESMAALLEDLLEDESVTALLGTSVRPPTMAAAPIADANDEEAEEEDAAEESAGETEAENDAGASGAGGENASSSSILEKLSKYGDQF
jgi:serine/threonine protein kinase